MLFENLLRVGVVGWERKKILIGHGKGKIGLAILYILETGKSVREEKKKEKKAPQQ